MFVSKCTKRYQNFIIFYCRILKCNFLNETIGKTLVFCLNCANHGFHIWKPMFMWKVKKPNISKVNENRSDVINAIMSLESKNSIAWVFQYFWSILYNFKYIWKMHLRFVLKLLSIRLWEWSRKIGVLNHSVYDVMSLGW